MQKNNVRYFSISYIKIKSNWINDVNIKAKTLKIIQISNK